MILQRNNKYKNKIAKGISTVLLTSMLLTGCQDITQADSIITDNPVSTEQVVMIEQPNLKEKQNIEENKYEHYDIKYPHANWCMCDIFPVLIEDNNNNKKLLETYIVINNNLIHFYDLFTETELFTIPFSNDFSKLDENIKCINAKIDEATIKADYLKDKNIISVGRAGYELTFLIDLNSKNYEKAWENFDSVYGGTLKFQEFFMTTEKILSNYIKYVPEVYRVSSEDMELKSVYSIEDKLADCWKIDETEIGKRIEELNINKDNENLNFSIGEVQALVMKDSEGNFKILNVTMQRENKTLHVFDLYTREELFVVPIVKMLDHDSSTGIYVGIDFNNIDLAIDYFNDKQILYMIDSKQMKFFLIDNYDELCKNDSINYDPVPETIINISYPNTVIEIGEYYMSIKDFARIYVSLPEGMYVTAKELGFDKDKVKSLD